jgi:SAM-dependent methyltransferase
VPGSGCFDDDAPLGTVRPRWLIEAMIGLPDDEVGGSMAEPHPHDVWAVADAYERYVGRWSRLVAAEFVAWLAMQAGARWLDVGCGSGALTETIVLVANPSYVLGVDPSEGFLEQAQARLANQGVSFQVGDADALPVPDRSFDAVVGGLVLNFVPDADHALGEFRRVARHGAIVGAYVWDYAGSMELMRHFWDAAVALDPAAHSLDEGVRFPLADERPLRELFSRAGLAGVSTRGIDVPTKFESFDDFWLPFLGGQGPAPAYAASLAPARRDALRDRIRSGLPIAGDGSIALRARAWAVKGRVPY